MQGHYPSFRPGVPQQPPPTQPYAPQQIPTSQPDLPPLSTQSQPQHPSFSGEDLENVLRNELLRVGTHILQLVDGQTRAVEEKRIADAFRLSEQCDQEMDRYKERSEFVVRALEARRAWAKAMLDPRLQWSSHPTGEPVESNNGRWSVTLQWSHMEKVYQTRVLAADIMGSPLPETLPDCLPLEGVECAMDIRGFQDWIQKAKKKTGNSEPSTAQFQPASENERNSFNQLIKWLREGSGYAVANWAIRSGGSSKPNLLLRPCPDKQEPGLMGAIFPASVMPPLPQPQAGFSPTDNMSSVPASGGVGYVQQAPHVSVYGSRTNATGSGPAAQPMSSQNYQQRQPQWAYSQGQQTQPQAPQNQQRGWQGTQYTETGAFGATRGEDTDGVHKYFGATRWPS